MTFRILICEDDARFRRLIAKVLDEQDDMEVHAVGDGEAALERLAGDRFDLVLLDLELPNKDGLEVLQELGRSALRPLPEILILTSFVSERRLFEAMRLGAAGYLVKGRAPAEVLSSIREVLAGGTVIDPRLARRFWNHFAASVGRQQMDYGLDPVELDVLTMVARGLSNPEAARVLGATRRSIKAQLEVIYEKLGVHGRVEAAVKALRAGLIEL